MGRWASCIVIFRVSVIDLLICLFTTFRKAEKSIADIENLHRARKGVQLYLPNNAGINHQEKVLKILLVLTIQKFKLLLLLISFLCFLQVLKSQLYVDRISETVQPTFLDYMTGGWELNFMVAIDFTGT